MEAQKGTNVQFPDSHSNFSIVDVFKKHIEANNVALDLVCSLNKMARKMLKCPKQNNENQWKNMMASANIVKTYASFRKTVLADHLYILELVRKLTPEQRLIYQDMRKAMGVDVLGHALEGSLDVGEIFGLQKKVKGKNSLLDDAE